MKKTSSALLVLLLLSLMGSFCAESPKQGSSEAPAKAVDSNEITEQNLMASERFWPYQVKLTAPQSVVGRSEPLPAGVAGVLIRVESSGLPRVDFGSLGKYEIPVRNTDLLERANGIRTGEVQKAEPNFTHAIKARMLDSASDSPQMLPADHAVGWQGFLCVFADPGAEGFDELVKELVPLREWPGVMTIFFPQGTHPDPELRERLRSLEWPVPFLSDFLSEPYTSTLLIEGTPTPFAMLQTNEGRVLFQGRLTGDESDLVMALNVGFGAGISSSTTDPKRAH